MSNPQTYPGTTAGQETKAQPGIRWFSLREKVDIGIRYVELGILLALPIVVAVFSKTYALAIIATEILAYYLGVLICDFDTWYNSRNIPILKYKEKDSSDVTELEIILGRLSHFEDKYLMSIKVMYIFLDRNEIPKGDNLDWIETVSLLNKLSLYVGKHFEEDCEKGNKE